MTVMRSRRIKRGHVYVISASNGFVKIGSTGGSPFERFGMVACHSPLPVNLAYVCECSHPVDVEEAVHRILEQHREHREWFNTSAANAIDAVRAVIQARGYMVVQTEGRKQSSVGAAIVHRCALAEMALPQ